jgi:uncharacterized membrane protein YphA (DoxX/SURF4 family)
MTSKGYPSEFEPLYALYGACGLMGVGSLLLVLGFETVGASLLTLFLIPTTYFMHIAPFLASYEKGELVQTELSNALKNTALAGALILIACNGCCKGKSSQVSSTKKTQ